MRRVLIGIYYMQGDDVHVSSFLDPCNAWNKQDYTQPYTTCRFSIRTEMHGGSIFLCVAFVGCVADIEQTKVDRCCLRRVAFSSSQCPPHVGSLDQISLYASCPRAGAIVNCFQPLHTTRVFTSLSSHHTSQQFLCICKIFFPFLNVNLLLRTIYVDFVISWELEKKLFYLKYQAQSLWHATTRSNPTRNGEINCERETSVWLLRPVFLVSERALPIVWKPY